jgi:hypothetical protein
MKPFRFPSFAFALVIALAFAFVLASPVFAQDELPPAPEATPAAEPTPLVEVAPEVAPVEELLPVEEPPAASIEEPAAVVVEESAPPVEEPVVEAAPEIIPLDEGGQVLSLASQEAAKVMAEPDPWFLCTIDDVDGLVDGKCNYLGANSLNIALGAYTAKGGSGPIYLASGPAHTVTTNVIINGTTVPNLTGIMADTGGSSADVLLTLGVFHIEVYNTIKGFTLKGLNIDGNYTSGGLSDGLVYFWGNTGNLALTDLVIKNNAANGDGLDINGHTGSVTLNTVKSDRNGDEGAKITGVSGSVSITNSSFDDNSQGGSGALKNSLYISSTGKVTLTGVSASNFHRGNGALLQSNTGVTVKNSLFNNNYDSTPDPVTDDYGNGLAIASGTKGSILLDHVYANNNQLAGISIYTSIGGAVTLSTIEATGNRTGVKINNCWGFPCTTTTGAVSLTNLTLHNQYGNLWVLANGAITGTNIESTTAYALSGAGGFGGIILNNYPARAVSSVTLNNIYSDSNAIAGVDITSKGAVTLNHVTASNNNFGTANGISINTTGAVTIASTLGANGASDNTGNGVSISTSGAVSISKLTTYSNTSTNLYIDNSVGTGAVTVTTGSFNNSDGGSGVVVTSRGAITLTDVSAYYNAVDGIILSNETGSSQPVTVKTSSTSLTIDLSRNPGSALEITSKGTVTVSGLYIYDWSSGNSPVYIRNTYGSAGTVSLSNSGIYYVNDPSNVAAVAIYSNGTVTINNLDIDENYDRGLFIDNSTASGTPGVTITGLYLENNDFTGVEIASKGAIKWTNAQVSSMDGGEAGAKITTSGSVTIDAPVGGSNYFSNNIGNGLMIDADGAVTIINTYAYGNSGYGLGISNGTIVSISNGQFYTNTTSIGLDVVSSGAITLTKVNAYSNGTYGIRLNNSSGTAGVTITGPSSGWMYLYDNPTNLSISTTGPTKMSYLDSNSSPFALDLPLIVGDVTLNTVYISNTSGNAVTINSKGTVTVTNVNTTSTSGSGLVIDNTYATTAKPVTITNFQDTSTTGLYALYVKSKGAITLTDFYVEGGNVRDYGIYLDNSLGTKAAVTVKKPISSNYAYYFDVSGVNILSDGLVTLDWLSLNYNNTGLTVNTTNGGVTVTNSTLSSNTSGMNIKAGGAIVITNVFSRYNDETGVTLKNDSAAPAAPVTILDLRVNDNDTGGLKINSIGAVTITNLYAGGQDISGYGLDITTTGSVTMGYTGSTWNDLTGNAGSGGIIQAGGNVTLKRINANTNTGGSGLEVTSTSGSVAITDATFNYNNTFGLDVLISSGIGGITLTNVDAYQNINPTWYGATLDNILGTGGITINGTYSDHSQFNNNNSINVDLRTNGAVTLNYVDANNSSTGIKFPITPVGNVSMNTVSVDNISGGYGLYFESLGTVTLSHISAETDSGGGVFIENSNAATPKNVTLLDIYVPGNAGIYALWVHSKGAISTKDLYLYDSGSRSYGARLDNALAGAIAGVTVGVSSSSNNNLASYFTNEALNIISNGPVSVQNYESYYSNIGLLVDNQAGGVGTGSVTLTNINISNSVSDGMFISTNGNVSLTNATSANNGTSGTGRGIDILVGLTPSSFSGTVTLTNVDAHYNRGDELRVQSHRAITVKNLDTYDYSYSGSGAILTTDGGGVSLLDPGGEDWNWFRYNNGTDLYIHASGDVVLQKLWADSSQASYGTQVITTGKVTVTNMKASASFLDGLNISAGGAISVSGLYMQSNQNGAVLDNSSGTGGVTVSSSTFYNNYRSTPVAGLFIETNGAVLLNQVSATTNSGYGAFITVNGPSTAAVAVNKSVFSQNYNDGLKVVSLGSITINGITANDNYSGGSGVVLDNSAGTGTVSVLATLGANTFNGNNTNGLAISSSGAVVINSVTANDNSGGVGIGVLNSTAAAGAGTVTITGAIVKHNYNNGIAVTSRGVTTLSSIEAISNSISPDNAGIDIFTNGYNAVVQNSVVSGNGQYGIIASVGAGHTLTVKKTYYMGNNRGTPASFDPNLYVPPGLGSLVIVP